VQVETHDLTLPRSPPVESRPRDVANYRRRVVVARRVLAGSALALLLSCSNDSVQPLERAAPAPAFRIVYRLEQPKSPTRWSELIVERPFMARTGTNDHRPAPGARPDNGTLTTVDGLYQLRPEGVQEISGRQPSPGTGDQHLTADVDELVDRKQARLVSSATVAGLRCTVYRFVEPPVGPIKALTGTDHDDLCLTPDGLVLREEWTLDGRVVLRRTAVEVTHSPKGLRRAFDVRDAAPAPPSGPVATVAAARSSFLPDPKPPSGFRLARRDSFALRQPSDAGPVTLYTSTVWAFTRGSEVVTVEAGDSRASGQLPWLPSDVSRPVGLPLGRAESVMRNDGTELRVDLGGARWVRVRGTVPLAALVRYATTLRAA
jgi:hypothetical protein